MSQKTFLGRTLPVWQGGLIVLLIFLAYLPAWHGGFVWDDDAWTTNLSALFQSPSGLRLIWFQPTVLQQYYPLSGTTFWLDYQLWKFWTTPYHLENLLLHALAALLFWRLLLQLDVRGAWLAAALFAVHPVMVESVAWITERKNVLSLVLFLGAGLAYGRFAPWKSRRGKPRLLTRPAAGGVRHCFTLWPWSCFAARCWPRPSRFHCRQSFCWWTGGNAGKSAGVRT